MASSADHTRLRPVALELAVVAAIYLAYRSGRTISRGAADEALRNAADIVHLEQAFGIFHEQALQQVVLQSRTLVDLLNHYYVIVHFPATVAFLIWAYLRHHDAYRVIRTWFAGVTLLALALHVVYPLAPPRMTIGFVDTLRVFGPRIYDPDTTRSVANQFAAMPSLHFGWALMMGVSIVLIRQSRRSLLALAHPAITLVAIVATGNHYWLDAIVVTVIAAAVGVLVLALCPLPHRSRAAEMLPRAVSVVAVRGAEPGSTPPRITVVGATGPSPRCRRRPTPPRWESTLERRERTPIGRGASLTVPTPATSGVSSP